MFKHSHIFTVALITILTCSACASAWFCSNAFLGLVAILAGLLSVIGVIITGE
jgi:hypothetical protein